ncbi:twin-arginine translocation signal domain-containing protein [Micromonospora purpureochromogenes]|uniref:twin-arginine translocation signal domain-containing protein n=1 Tax=Micromonospora purpureochromogenes TaxID=47872 RepID=UPI0033219251
MKDKDLEGAERSQLSRRQLVKYAGVGATLAAASPLVGGGAAWANDDREDDKRDKGGESRNRVWRAGDHHIHSEYSGEFDTSTNPPTFHKAPTRCTRSSPTRSWRRTSA